MKFGSNDSVLKYLSDGVNNIKLTRGWLIQTEEQAKYILNEFSKAFDRHRHEFKQIDYWTTPFYQAYIKAKKSIHESLLKEQVVPDGRYSGVVVANIIGESVTYYSFDVESYGGGCKMKNGFMATFQKHILCSLWIAESGSGGYIQYLSDGMIDIGFTIDEVLDDIVKMCLFKKFCEVEIKNLPPKTKTEAFRCKYINQTNLSVNIIDSTWFTTIVQSSSFDVRGHFRLQPYGEGMKDRKWIWINPYRKNGYTAPARKLKAEAEK